jgi:hypothetical protein
MCNDVCAGATDAQGRWSSGHGSLERWVRADHGRGQEDVGVWDVVNGAVLAPLEKVGVGEFVFEPRVDDRVEHANGLACLAEELPEDHGYVVGGLEVGLTGEKVGVP